MKGTSADNPIGQGSATLVLGLATLISHGFGLSLVPAMLPRISDDLGVGYGPLGVAVATGLVAYSIGGLSAGRVLDRLPTRELLAGSVGVSAIGLLVAGAATSTAVLTLAVVILGFIAPVSWAVTLHVAGATTSADARAAVMAGASGGAALGVLINGVLVQTSDSIHSWRVSFVIAAALAILPVIGSLILYRRPIRRPSANSGAIRGGFRLTLATRAGRVVLLAGVAAGIAGFPFNVFLTATAIDEMHVSALAAGAIWWLIGVIGIVAGLILGRHADRTSPLRSLAVGAAAYVGGLIVLVSVWNYTGLLIAAVGYAFMNYPIWGLAGAAANRQFEPAVAVRAISLGLVGASLGGAIGNAVAGAWIDATSSFRGPVLAMMLMMLALVGWYLAIIRDGGLESTTEWSAGDQTVL